MDRTGPHLASVGCLAGISTGDLGKAGEGRKLSHAGERDSYTGDVVGSKLIATTRPRNKLDPTYNLLLPRPPPKTLMW